MTRNKIYAIVEGHGEANPPPSGGQPAVYVLISKLLQELQCWTLFVRGRIPPFRMKYGEFFRDDKLERVIRYHDKYEDCAAVLILLDMDDDCPKEKALEIANRIRNMGTLPFSVVIVCAKREYEAWFLASLEMIHDGRVYDGEPEEKRDAKGWLRRQFGYKPTRHQAEYTYAIDTTLACERSRSFRRLYHAFQELVEAVKEGQPIVSPAASSR